MGIMEENNIWPECDPGRQRLFYKVVDAFCYPYMYNILDKGAKLHKERLKFNDDGGGGSSILDGSKKKRHGAGEEDGKSLEKAASPQEMEIADLYNAPHYMKADVLQSKFNRLLSKKTASLLKQLNLTPSTAIPPPSPSTLSRTRKYALLQVLWSVSQPTYLHAGLWQLLTVLIQTLTPLIIRHILKLIERYPDRAIFSEGILFVLALFFGSALDGIAQERFKYLSFQAGITIRAATIGSIYSHVLHLDSTGKRALMGGETTNLVAIDCQKLFEVCQEGHLVWSCPLSMVIVTVLLLLTLGPVTLVGMACMYLLVPIVRVVVGRMMVLRRNRAVFTDRRVEVTTATLRAIKFCKLNNYEVKFLGRIREARAEEMVWVRKELMYIG